MKRKRITIGITGGVSSGKSVVAKSFRRLGATIIDADKIAHRLLSQSDVKKECMKKWGDDILKNGSVNRVKLGQIVFNDNKSLDALMKILHPRIKKEIYDKIKKSRGVVVIDAPLLVESGLLNICDYMVFVKSSLTRRIKMAKNRHGWTRSQLLKREKFQAPLAYKIKIADYVIDNTGTLKNTKNQVEMIFNHIKDK